MAKPASADRNRSGNRSRSRATTGLSPSTQQTRPESWEQEQEQIRTRAYEIYCERNGQPGNAVEDWVRAEQEIAGARFTPQERPRGERGATGGEGRQGEERAARAGTRR